MAKKETTKPISSEENNNIVELPNEIIDNIENFMSNCDPSSWSIYKKLAHCRFILNRLTIKKSGYNKFSGFYYYELGDFLPSINYLCFLHDLLPVFNLNTTDGVATLTIKDVNDDSKTIVFQNPIADNSVKGCTPIQNLGSINTYLKRYLYLNAFEITEADTADSLTGSNLTIEGNVNLLKKSITPSPFTPKLSSVTANETQPTSKDTNRNLESNTVNTTINTETNASVKTNVVPTLQEVKATSQVETISVAQNEENSKKYAQDIRERMNPQNPKAVPFKDIKNLIVSLGLPLSLAGITKEQHDTIVTEIERLANLK